MTNEFFLWLITSIIFFIFEMGSPGLFFFLSFSLGALITAIFSLFVDSMQLQLLVFVFGTAIGFVILRYWVKAKFLLGKHKQHPTNLYAMYGKKGVVTRTILKDMSGEVKVAGQIWSAKSVDNTEIHHGEQIEVVDLKGVHLFVRKV
jgi:membrane protein implicated in regulation of membrane protease activity